MIQDIITLFLLGLALFFLLKKIILPTKVKNLESDCSSGSCKGCSK